MVIYYLSKSQAVLYHFMVLYSETVNEGITFFFFNCRYFSWQTPIHPARPNADGTT